MQDPKPRSRESISSSRENMLTDVRRSVDTVINRYDFVSAGLGALAVTAFCWAHGQDPLTALWITAASTVVALLLNDMMFND